MSTKVKELTQDIEDLKRLLQLAERQKSKDLLSIEIRKLETKLIKETEGSAPSVQQTAVATSTSSSKCYEVKLNNHAWEQTDSFVKLYVNLQNVQTLPKESIICNFTERSMDLRVLNLDNKNYTLLINNLCESIVPEKSSVKVKTDMIIINLAKKVPLQWSHVTEVEKRIKESKMSKMETDKDADPGASLMNLMKKMYDEGDDDTKKAIAKAWTETHEKRASNMDTF